MRVLAVALTLLAATPAAAGPGGSLDGELSVEWTSGAAEPGNAWNGAVSLALEGGDAATQHATQALRDSGRTYREVRPFFVQSSQVTALSSQYSTRTGGAEWCWDPDSGQQLPGETTSWWNTSAVTQPLVPFVVNQPDVDLLKGKGRVEIELYTDNPGYAKGSDTWPFPAAGEYFMPIPGTATATYGQSHCGESSSETGDAPVFNTRSDGLVPFAFALWLNEAELPLRRVDGTWRIQLEKREESMSDDGSGIPLTMRYRMNLRMSDDLKGMEARCRVPDGQVRRARSAQAARKVLRRAGFPKARFLGDKPYIGLKRKRYLVDPDFTSSGYLRCGTRGRFIRAVPMP